MLIFRGDFVHAGSGYDTDNYRIHYYLDSPLVPRVANRTWLIDKSSHEELRRIIQASTNPREETSIVTLPKEKKWPKESAPQAVRFFNAPQKSARTHKLDEDITENSGEGDSEEFVSKRRYLGS